MDALAAAALAIDRVNRAVGRAAAWLALYLVLAQFALVLMRYVFGIASIFVQESLVYAHGLMFMLAAGYTLLADGHVRVDIFYREASPRTKAWIDMLGVCFLLMPFLALLWIVALPYVASSWAVLERSRETSGIPAVFLLKSVILLFVVLMALQGVSLAARSALTLSGRPQAAPRRQGP